MSNTYNPPTKEVLKAKVDALSTDELRALLVAALMEVINRAPARLDWEAHARALAAALRWWLHIINGVGKGGGPPEEGEPTEAMASATKALAAYDAAVGTVPEGGTGGPDLCFCNGKDGRYYRDHEGHSRGDGACVHGTMFMRGGTGGSEG